MLDRVGGEVARATSIVRYAPGSQFSEHTHSGGEEFIVLEGVFQDEHGDYPAGTYVRNPIGTHHVPGSEPGCTIFVKLWQFDEEDQDQKSIDIGSATYQPRTSGDGVQEVLLHQDARETVVAQRWTAGTQCVIGSSGGAEFLLLEGSVDTTRGNMGKHDWLRVPAGHAVTIKAGPAGAWLWSKSGHLRHIRIPE